MEKKMLNNGRHLNATDVRKHLFDIINKVNDESLPYTITINGRPEAVIMSKDDYDAWTATIETLCDRDLIQKILEGDADIKRGRFSDWEKVKKNLQISTNVSNNTRKQSNKRTQKTR
ncbi:MAG: type II toxin-antitoxin system Phd/YefM family antitoxin [Planctomycetes bacterium]|nr:type II toxin-antitoxin system Phd/YefM family antitoxin [Planctomycetota bacterium]